MPIPFLSSINLTKNEVENFKIYNLANDPGTLTSGGDFGYFWLNTSSQKTLKWWDGANVRSIVDSTNIGSYTSGLATDLAGGGAGQIVYQNAANDTMFLSAGTSGQVLSSNGTSAPSWLNQSSLSVGSATTATTANAVANALTAGTYLTSGGTFDGSVARTFAVDATDANTASKVVARDASGNFAAGTITATRVTGLSAPSAGSDAANRDYVDGVAQGLDVKASCLVATTTNIDLANPGAITIDNVYSATFFTAGTTRILVKDQSAPAENGIYIWQGPAAAMTRSADANTWDELIGAFTFIENVNTTPQPTNENSGWVCTAEVGGTLGSTAVTFVKFSQAGSYTAGNGIVQSGTSFNFAQSSAYTAGQIPFASSTTAMGFNANLHWDNSNNRLGIGTATPATALHVFGTGSQALSVERDGATIQSRLEIVSGNSTNLIRATVAKDLLVEQGTGTEVIRIATNGVCTWSNVVNAGTAMTLNGTGLGVGGSIFSNSKLTLVSAAGVDCMLALQKTGGSNTSVIMTDGTNAWLGSSSGSTGKKLIYALAAPDNSVVVNSSGNVGLGVTPSAWQANWKVLQFANGSSIGNPFNGEGTFVGSNVYRNSSGDYIRLDTGYAAMYMQLSGSHRWHVAGTSNAGSTIPSFSPGSQAMTLDASGNLLVGTASASGSLTVVGAQSVDGSTYYVASLAANNSPVAGRGSGLAFRTNVGSFTPVICAIEGVKENGTTDDYASALDFSTRVNGGLMTKRLRIDSSGNVGIGTTTPIPYAANARVLHIDGGANSSEIRLTNNTTGTANTDGGLLTMSGSNLYVWNNENASVIFGTNNGTKATLDSSGNLGLGVTPSGWGAGLKALQVGAVSYGSLFDFGNGVTSLSSNLFFSGSSYGRMSTSSRWSMAYWQDITNGAHSWVTSTAAGTNASTPTMSTLMTLDSSGKLGIGSTPSTNLSIGSGSGSGGYGGGVYLNRGGSSYNFYEAGDGTNTVIFGLDHTLSYAKIGSINSYPISLITDNSVRLTVKATGQVNFVGLASDPAGAAGDVYYNSGSNLFRVYDTGWKTLPRKYSTALAGTSTTFDVTHNLGTQDVTVMVRKSASTFDVVYTDIQVATTNKVTIVFASSVTGSDYTVTVIG